MVLVFLKRNDMNVMKIVMSSVMKILFESLFILFLIIILIATSPILYCVWVIVSAGFEVSAVRQKIAEP